MKLLLLKVLLQRRARDEGFTLPVVIAMGLIMVLVGLVNIISASDENLTAITTNSSNDSLSVAEIGVARYRKLLDTNRVLSLYNVYTDTGNNRVDRWTGTDATNATYGSANIFGVNNVCSEDIATFSNRNTWHNIILREVDASADFNRDGDQTDTINMGQYRLVSYIYDIDGDLTNEDLIVLNPTALPANQIRVANFSQTNDTTDINNNPIPNPPGSPRGILTVQGRTSADGAVSQIEVEIPIRLNQQDMDNLAPALWIGNGIISNLGNLVIADGSDPDAFSDTNIVVSAPTDGTNAGCGNADPDDTDQNVIVSDPRDIPPIRSIVDTIVTARSDNGDQTNSVLTPILGRPAFSSTPDKPYVQSSDGNSFIDYANRDLTTNNWDCYDIRDCRYYYDLTNTTINNNIQTDGIAKATLYINGNLIINSGANYIGSAISSNYLEIYVDGLNNNITIDTGAAGNTINIDALIHAPQATLTINGAGDVNFGGSVWVNSFVNNTTGTVTINPDDTDVSSTSSDKSYKFYTTTSTRVPRPITGSPTDWKTEEVE